MSDTWYRFEDYRTAAYDPWAEFEQPSGSDPAIRLRTYFVHRETPKGVWLSEGAKGGWHTFPRFVLRETTKRFACPTVQEAYESWQARKRKQRAIYEARLRNVDEAEDLMRHMVASHQFPDLKLPDIDAYIKEMS